MLLHSSVAMEKHFATIDYFLLSDSIVFMSKFNGLQVIRQFIILVTFGNLSNNSLNEVECCYLIFLDKGIDPPM